MNRHIKDNIISFYTDIATQFFLSKLTYTNRSCHSEMSIRFNRTYTVQPNYSLPDASVNSKLLRKTASINII